MQPRTCHLIVIEGRVCLTALAMHPEGIPRPLGSCSAKARSSGAGVATEARPQRCGPPEPCAVQRCSCGAPRGLRLGRASGRARDGASRPRRVRPRPRPPAGAASASWRWSATAGSPAAVVRPGELASSAGGCSASARKRPRVAGREIVAGSVRGSPASAGVLPMLLRVRRPLSIPRDARFPGASPVVRGLRGEYGGSASSVPPPASVVGGAGKGSA